MKIPSKFLKAAAKLFTKEGKSVLSKRGRPSKLGIGSYRADAASYMNQYRAQKADASSLKKGADYVKAWKARTGGESMSLSDLEGARKINSGYGLMSRNKRVKLAKDKYGNTSSLDVNKDRIPSWRMGEKYGPGESSKFNPFK